MFLVAETSFAIDAQLDKRSSLRDFTSRLQLDHTTRNKSCQLLLLMRMSVDEQSEPTKTRSLCARKEKRKKNSQKIISRECCWWPKRRLQSTRSTTSAVRCETGIPVATGPYHNAQVVPPSSADAHVIRRPIRTNQNAFTLCDKTRIHKK